MPNSYHSPPVLPGKFFRPFLAVLLCLLASWTLVALQSCNSLTNKTLEAEIKQVDAHFFEVMPQYTDPDAVISRLREARSRTESLRLLLLLGEKFINLDAQVALEYAEEAYRMAGYYKDEFLSAQAQYWMALAKTHLFYFREVSSSALKDVQIAKGKFDLNNEGFWEANALILEAQIYFKMNPDSAEELSQILNEASRIVRQENLDEEVRAKLTSEVLHLQGEAHLQQGDSSKAIDAFVEAEKLLKKLDHQEGLGRISYSIGRFWEGKQNYPRAEAYYQKGLLISEDTQNHDLKQSCLQAIGNLYLRKIKNHYQTSGNSAEAALYRDSLMFLALKKYKDQGSLNPLYRKWAYKNLAQGFIYGNYYVERNKYLDSAYFYYARSFELAEKEQDLSTLVSILENVNRYHAYDEHRVAIEKYFKSHRDMGHLMKAVDELRSDLMAKVANSAKDLEDFKFEFINRKTKEKHLRTIFIAGGIILLMLALVVISYLSAQNQKLQSRISVLGAQMNPHFTANTINAIEGLILKDEKAKASDALITFARLSRSMLYGAVDGEISLEEELKMLEAYTDLMKLRYGEKLQTRILVEEGLNPGLVQVPAMMIQPFVENAIIHGINPKESGVGQVLVNLKKEGKKLKIYVDDNGIGRKQARKNNDNSLKGERSLGMEITKSRIQAISNMAEAKLEVKDKEGEAGEAQGTTVVITLPLKKIDENENKTY